MFSEWLDRLRGTVVVEIRGFRPDAMLDAMRSANIVVRQAKFRRIERRGGAVEDVLEVRLSTRDALRLRPLLKRTGCRMRVRAKYGWPFWLARLSRNASFAVGACMFTAVFFLLSQIVWDVDVEIEGSRLATEQVLKAAETYGLRPYRWKFSLPPVETMAAELYRYIPDASWIGVEWRGTRATIRVVEMKRPEPRPVKGPRHLVASRDAEVTAIFAETGRPVVRPHALVRKGDVLISGWIGTDERKIAVAAEGTVRGLVWDIVEVEVPLARTVRTYTGGTSVRYAVAWGDRRFRLPGVGTAKSGEDKVEERLFTLRWGDWVSPLGVVRQEVRRTRTATIVWTQEQAMEAARAEIRKAVEFRYGEEIGPVRENILQVRADNDKVYLKAHVEVEIDIAQEQPIAPAENGASS